MRASERSALDTKWHWVDDRCQSLGEQCPAKARDKIGEAATRLAQSDEYAQRGYFLQAARAALSAANREMEKITS